MQLSIKVGVLNSAYGQMGSPYFPLFDLDNALSVTSSGQTILKNAFEFLPKVVSGCSEDTCVAGDTDSCAVNLSHYVSSNNYNLSKKDDVDKVCEFLAKVEKQLNDNCNTIAKDVFHSDELNRLKFSREILADCGTFTAKKNYILHLVDKEGIYVGDKEKWKIMGLQIKKSEISPEIRKDLAKLIKDSVMTPINNNSFQNKALTMWDKFVTMSVDQIAFYKGYNTEKTMDGFLDASSGTGGVAKAANYWNQLIDALKLKHKYPEIKAGEKVRFVYIKDHNDYGIDSIGWPTSITFPPEFQELFEVDYQVMFEKTVMKPLKTFMEIYQWNKFNPSCQVEFDIFDL